MIRLLVATALFVMFVVPAQAADTPKAAKTRDLLKMKITADWKDTPLKDAIDEIKEQVKGLSIRLDGKGGVSGNRKVTLQQKDPLTVADALDKILGKEGWGYIVISNTGNAYDGSVLIKVGKERGYEEGQEPRKDK